MADEPKRLNVEWVPRERLFANPANPRVNDAAVPHVVASIRRFGWQQPIVARPSGEVIAGNTRLKAADELNAAEVPVAWFTGDSLDAVAYAIADNRSHEFAEWDEVGLAKLLEELRAEDALEGVGFTGQQIDELLAEIEAQAEAYEVDDPGPEELPEDPVSQPGDLWILGRHLLLCGDARDPAKMEELLQGKQADLVWTDPPYGVSYEGKTADALTIQNDGQEGLGALLEAALGNAAKVCRPGAVWYVAAPAGPQFAQFGRVLTDLGVWRQSLVWVKDAFVLGHSDFHYRHEALLYGWVPGGDHRRPPERTHDSVWECDRPRCNAEHPTTKPLDLVTRALELSTKPNDLVLDPFLGSGTVLVAAEQQGRRCRGMELDPRYVDVAVRRWEQATGRKASCADTGEPFPDRGAS